MGVTEIRFDWYNPHNPKCRNCRYWSGSGMDYGKPCTNPDFKGNNWRDHNSRACVRFRGLRRAGGG